MTLDEAIAKLVDAKISSVQFPAFLFVRACEVLGLLHLETTEDKVRIAAVERLTLATTYVIGGTGITEHAGKITRDGALEILDVLTKSGFRITRE